jgi:hypothetical protein
MSTPNPYYRPLDVEHARGMLSRAQAAGKFVPGGTDDCWPWLGVIDRGGYGLVKPNRASVVLAHRLVYTVLVGPIPHRAALDHTCHAKDETCRGGASCRHRRCVNPAHLEPMDHVENTMRGRGFVAVNAAKTHCDNGHPFDAENARPRPSGGRACKACDRQRQREYKQRRHARLSGAEAA